MKYATARSYAVDIVGNGRCSDPEKAARRPAAYYGGELIRLPTKRARVLATEALRRVRTSGLPTRPHRC
jgi:hypothetical protein